jgi:hypothetical protein
MDSLGAVLLAHPREVDFNQLGLEPDRFSVQRQNLPDLDDFRQPWEGVEVHGELEPVSIPSLLQKLLGLREVVPAVYSTR